ncbi:MAG: terpene cyclase/mutase family protein [Planctomyces sp.]|nr:terpene cyclase/mutase family protein [Planctomyces sp.]
MTLHLQFICLILSQLCVPFHCLQADERDADPRQYQDEADLAVDRGLKLLQQRQISVAEAAAMRSPELAGSFEDQFVPGNTGIASLSVLAFLARGHLPGQGPFGETINRGVDYVLSQQLDNGLLVSRNPEGRRVEMMYSHSIATLLLCEVSGMLDKERQKKLDNVLPKALLVLLQAQRVPKGPMHSGGWRYAPGAIDSDLSLTGWSIMALRAAKLNGAAIPDEHITDAVEYILKCRQPNGSFSYMPGHGQGTSSMTGLAVLCLELCGEHGHESIEPAGEYLLLNPPRFANAEDGNRFRHYALYYCAQATFQLGDRYWKKFAPFMYETLLSEQREDGSWGVPSEGGAFGNTYTTALAVLTLTVSARQLPIYQREE